MRVKKSVGWPEIDELLNECLEKHEAQQTSFPERTYEDGVKAGVEWVTGIYSDHPLQKEE